MYYYFVCARANETITCTNIFFFFFRNNLTYTGEYIIPITTKKLITQYNMLYATLHVEKRVYRDGCITFARFRARCGVYYGTGLGRGETTTAKKEENRVAVLQRNFIVVFSQIHTHTPHPSVFILKIYTHSYIYIYVYIQSGPNVVRFCSRRARRKTTNIFIIVVMKFMC